MTQSRVVQQAPPNRWPHHSRRGPDHGHCANRHTIPVFKTPEAAAVCRRPSGPTSLRPGARVGPSSPGRSTAASRWWRRRRFRSVSGHGRSERCRVDDFVLCWGTREGAFAVRHLPLYLRAPVGFTGLVASTLVGLLAPLFERRLNRQEDYRSTFMLSNPSEPLGSPRALPPACIGPF